MSEELDRAYRERCATPSDISEHLPTLRKYASRVNRVTEFGVRNGNSTIALLHGRPPMMLSYDVDPCAAAVEEALRVRSPETLFRFYQADTRSMPLIFETDLLFIDTLHTRGQLAAELAAHAKAVNRYIIIHDTETFGIVGEGGEPGIWGAIEGFLAGDEWRQREHFSNCNGLTVLERVRPAISVITPSRGRSTILARGFLSLFERADAPRDIEAIVVADYDDESMRGAEHALQVGLRYGLRVDVRQADRRGYARLHEYYNGLAAGADGDFVLVWNDDMEVLTPQWDLRVRTADDFSVQQLRRDIVEEADCTCPVVSRAVYDAMEHISLSPYVDTWLSQVARTAGVRVPRNDVVFRHECLRDRTFDEHGVVGAVPSADLQAEGHGGVLIEDAEKIVRAMARRVG